MSIHLTVRNRRYLEEMGLGPIWRLRDEAEAEVDAISCAAIEGGADSGFGQHRSPRPSVATNRAGGVQETLAGPIPSDGSVYLPGETVGVGNPRHPHDTAHAWQRLRETVADCQACGLCRQRKQAVLGVGDLQPDLLLIGEGPGAEEDQRGEPFVGQAGKLLDAMLSAIGLARGDKVYIANAVKCRPPGNRTPEPSEMAACRPYLEQQIALLQPRMILLLGRAAAHSVLNDDRALAALRGKAFAYSDIPVLVTYHPAYLLRNLVDKAKAWEDLCRVRGTLSRLRG